MEAQGSIAKFVGGSAEFDGDTLDLERRAVVADAGAGGHAGGIGCGEQLRWQAIEMSARRANPDANGHWRLVEPIEQHGHAIARNNGAGGVDLQNKGLRPIGLSLLDRLGNRVDKNLVDQAADLHDIDWRKRIGGSVGGTRNVG